MSTSMPIPHEPLPEPTSRRSGALVRLAQPIATPRLKLRPLMVEDAPRVAMFVGDFEVSKMLVRVPFPYSERNAREFITGAAQGKALAIVHANGVIGVVGLDEKQDGGMELGYWLGKPFWGRGFATEAAGAVMAAARTQSPQLEITSSCFAENWRSARVLTKLGFAPSGERDAFCMARGHKVRLIEMRLSQLQSMSAAVTRAASRPGLVSS